MWWCVCGGGGGGGLERVGKSMSPQKSETKFVKNVRSKQTKFVDGIDEGYVDQNKLTKCSGRHTTASFPPPPRYLMVRPIGWTRHRQPEGHGTPRCFHWKTFTRTSTYDLLADLAKSGPITDTLSSQFSLCREHPWNDRASAWSIPKICLRRWLLAPMLGLCQTASQTVAGIAPA